MGERISNAISIMNKLLRYLGIETALIGIILGIVEYYGLFTLDFIGLNLLDLFFAGLLLVFILEILIIKIIRTYKNIQYEIKKPPKKKDENA